MHARSRLNQKSAETFTTGPPCSGLLALSATTAGLSLVTILFARSNLITLGSDVEGGDQEGYGGVFVGSADADVVESAVVADGEMDLTQY